jgi:glycosyltransferase involved in cell wall biosynthesis
VSEENGILVPPANTFALAEAILKLIEDTKLAQTMGQTGREIAEQKFAKEVVADKILKLYWKSLNGKN